MQDRIIRCYTVDYSILLLFIIIIIYYSTTSFSINDYTNKNKRTIICYADDMNILYKGKIPKTTLIETIKKSHIQDEHFLIVNFKC